MFTPGKIPNLAHIFHMGLKPPTRKELEPTKTSAHLHEVNFAIPYTSCRTLLRLVMTGPPNTYQSNTGVHFRKYSAGCLGIACPYGNEPSPKTHHTRRIIIPFRVLNNHFFVSPLRIGLLRSPSKWPI